MLPNDKFERLRASFLIARELSPPRRREYLDQLEPDLRREVISLLDEDVGDEGFSYRIMAGVPAMPSLARFLHTAARAFRRHPARNGD